MPKTSADQTQRRDAVNAALTLAIERKNMDMISLAMNNGGDAGTLLDAGIAQVNMDMITLALDKGANPNTLLFAGIVRGRPAGERLKDLFHAINENDSEKLQIGLHWVETALNRGADANATRKDGQGQAWTAIHWAHDKFREEVMDLLLNAGAKVDADSAEGTPLMRAVMKGDTKKAEYYLEHGADPTLVSGPKQDFPMHALETSVDYLKGTKAKLLARMMQHLSAPASEPPQPAPEPVAVATGEGIEVLHALELKLPPKQDPPLKTFRL